MNGTPIKHCPTCGASLSGDAQCCPRCGREMGPARTSSPQPPQVPYPQQAAYPPQVPYPQQAQVPYPQASYPQQGYLPPGGVPYPLYQPPAPKPRGFSNWSKGKKIGVIVAGLLALAVIAGAGVFLFQLVFHQHPKIDAQPPAGWTLASESERESLESSLKSAGSSTKGVTLDYLYEKGSRDDLVLIAHYPQYKMSFANPPYTDDVAEMEGWIAGNKPAMEKEWKNQGMLVTGISAEKFARAGVAVKMTTSMTGVSGDYVHQTYFLFCKNDVYYMIIVQAKNANVDEAAVDFVVDNMYLK